MDFNNLHTTTELSLRACFKHLYSFIPKQYRLAYDPEEVTQHLDEFYDPELSLDNRLQYKIARVPYEDRKSPWVALMWNTEGLQKSVDMFRRFDTKILGEGELRSQEAKSRQVQTPINLGFVSNSLTAMLELQEVLLLGLQDQEAIIAGTHKVLGDFTVNLQQVSFGNLYKLPRSKGTICTYGMTLLLNYPIIGFFTPGAARIVSIRTTYRDMEGNPQITDVIEPENL